MMGTLAETASAAMQQPAAQRAQAGVPLSYAAAVKLSVLLEQQQQPGIERVLSVEQDIDMVVEQSLFAASACGDSAAPTPGTPAPAAHQPLPALQLLDRKLYHAVQHEEHAVIAPVKQQQLQQMHTQESQELPRHIEAWSETTPRCMKSDSPCDCSTADMSCSIPSHATAPSSEAQAAWHKAGTLDVHKSRCALLNFVHGHIHEHCTSHAYASCINKHSSHAALHTVQSR